MQHVFIIGSKGIPARYGGYETFVENLTKNQVSKEIKYHVSCLAKDNKTFEHNGADCFNIKVPNIGPAKAIYYDIVAFKQCIKYIKNNKIEHPIVYVLTCRIGPFYRKLVKKVHKLNGRVFLNPDGHEWLRAKWPKSVRMYWKKSEVTMVKNSDLIICDSLNIEKYIIETYGEYQKNTTFISYGSDIIPSILDDNDPKFVGWLKEKGLESGQYYLSVGRFVPENNFETMIREFMASDTKKSFAIVTTEDDKFFIQLKKKLHFENDERIKFVGTVYNAELLKKIREKAFAYFHGHSVGGTNPSLLEALSYTQLNLLFDVGFNKEVGEDAAMYWNTDNGNLSKLIHKAEHLTKEEIDSFAEKAKKRITSFYSWSHIVDLYEKEFLR